MKPKQSTTNCDVQITNSNYFLSLFYVFTPFPRFKWMVILDLMSSWIRFCPPNCVLLCVQSNTFNAKIQKYEEEFLEEETRKQPSNKFNSFLLILFYTERIRPVINRFPDCGKNIGISLITSSICYVLVKAYNKRNFLYQ